MVSSSYPTRLPIPIHLGFRESNGVFEMKDKISRFAEQRVTRRLQHEAAAPPDALPSAVQAYNRIEKGNQAPPR